MSLNIIPAIGSKGVYNLKAPFNSLVVANTPYTCVAIRTLNDIISGGVDPFATYYQPNGVTQDLYNSDLISGVSIISLQSGAGAWVYVPSSYILNYPATNGVPYTATALAVSLGTVPNSLNITSLMGEITDLVYSLTGVFASVKPIALSLPQLIDPVTSETLEAIRTNRITVSMSTSAQNAVLKAQIVTMQQHINDLENFIMKNITTPSTNT